MQKLHPLRRQFTADKVDACRVAAGPCKAGDESKPDRIFGKQEDNGVRCGRRFGRERRRVGACEDDRNLLADQFGSHCWQSVVLTLGPAVFDRNVIAHDIAGLLQALMKSAQAF